MNHCAVNQIKVVEKNVMFQHRRHESTLKVHNRNNPQNIAWSDKVVDRLLERKIEFINTDQLNYIETKNRSIISLAKEYA